MVHLQLRAYPRAIEAFSRSLALRPDKEALSYRGWAYLRLDAPRLALPDFEAALGLDPADANALLGRGYARVRLGEVSKGVEDAKKALGKGTQQPPLLFSAACLYARAAAQMQAQARDGSNQYALQWYQQRSLELLRAALVSTPEGKRKAFWRANIRQEGDLVALRRTSELLDLARQYGE
jgi:tetratricopeptide (TPR) repeat protein